MSYLNESKLKNYLELIYPGYEFIHNKKVPNSNINDRPDYRNDELKLIIEFDGYLHYTSPNVVLKDINKDKIYKNMGYKVIRIPYFIQMCNKTIKFLFNNDLDIKQEYPHGFIDDKVILPSNFCELGIKRFLDDLDKFSFIKKDIIKSLIEKTKNIDNILKVLPNSLFKLIENKNIFNSYEEKPVIKFYNKYKELGGLSDIGEYSFFLRIFFSLTQEAYTGGESYLDREESFSHFVKVIKSKKEALLYFSSVDQVFSYS